MKKGFTLTEMLVVIAIIGLLAIIMVPSVIKVTSSINERNLESKKENILSAAELYATEHKELFNDKDEVEINVAELVINDYLKADNNKNYENCKIAGTIDGVASSDKTTSGCIIDPVNDVSMNGDFIKIRRTVSGYVATFDEESSASTTNSNDTLVIAVCNYLDSGVLIGQSSDGVTCKCDKTGVAPTKLVDSNGNKVNACIISGYTDNNWLLHDNVYYRVMGLYDLSNYNEGIVAKIITDDVVSE